MGVWTCRSQETAPELQNKNQEFSAHAEEECLALEDRMLTTCGMLPFEIVPKQTSVSS